MKIKNLLICGALLAPTMVGGSVAHAQNYTTDTDGAHATTDANITFDEDKDPVLPVDPDNPNHEVKPDNPNTGVGELMISYASNLDFGTGNKKSKGEFFANADNVKDTDANKTPIKITPFVSIKDSRGADRKGWTLTATLDSDFKTADGKHNLKGATITLSGLYSGAGSSTDPNAPTTVGSVELVSLESGGGEQPIATASATSGVGRNSIGLGKLDPTTNKTKGVKLNVPNSIIVEKGVEYKATVTYHLTEAP
ncbi:hypothetical protein GIX45_16665 [Erwinia sp. CPCC 100877]|nr:hypothetical protein [Erwinia sp. CPCC 100877]